MASSTLFRFFIELSDVDRGVYTRIDERVAQHPSEDQRRLVLRVLAMCLFYEDGITFGRGLSTTEDPALFVSDDTGRRKLWIDVGAPAGERLHRAAKSTARVAVVTDKDDAMLKQALSGIKIHHAKTIEVVRIARGFVDAISKTLAPRNEWVVTIHDGICTLSAMDNTVTVDLVRVALSDLV
jgi:uncharacterized protein YaeQ